MHFVLRRPGLFLNTSSDATLLRMVLEIAANTQVTDRDAPAFSAELEADVAQQDMQPLFIPGGPQGI